jgi:predicted aspartyl protease
LVAVLLFVATALAVSCATGPQATAPADSGPIRFFPRANLPLARVRVDGVDVGFMLIDTGSTTTVLDTKVADKLRLPRQGQMMVNGIGGRVSAGICQISELWVGGRSLGPRPATVLDLAPLAKNLGWPLAGIVGFDCLRDRVFTIDLVAGTITFPPPEAPKPPEVAATDLPGAAVTELRMVGGLPAVPGWIGARRQVWLQIDTGSNGSLALPLDAVRHSPDVVAGHANAAGQDTGVGGVGDLIQSRAGTVGVFGTQLTDVAIQVELPDGSGRLAAAAGDAGSAVLVGRMGNQVLRQFRITFDLPHHRLWALRRPVAAAP